MDIYYVNKNTQLNGDHEVHKTGCRYLPNVENRICPGSFFNCRDAVKKTKEYYTRVDGCYHCSNACHTS